MQLPPAETRIDKQIPCLPDDTKLILTADTGGATVYGVYAVVNVSSTVPPIVTPLQETVPEEGKDFPQWWPAIYTLPTGTTSVVVNYTAPQGMVTQPYS